MWKKTLVITAIIFSAGVLGYLGYGMYMKRFGIEGNRQAVFMDNGQVYFGYVRNPDNQIVKLTEVYYLKTSDLQSSDPNNKIILVKMGNELHSPENVMYINRDQILFYQNIDSGSKINDAIAKFAQKQIEASGVAGN